MHGCRHYANNLCPHAGLSVGAVIYRSSVSGPTSLLTIHSRLKQRETTSRERAQSHSTNSPQGYDGFYAVPKLSVQINERCMQ